VYFGTTFFSYSLASINYPLRHATDEIEYQNVGPSKFPTTISVGPDETTGVWSVWTDSADGESPETCDSSVEVADGGTIRSPQVAEDGGDMWWSVGYSGQ